MQRRGCFFVPVGDASIFDILQGSLWLPFALGEVLEGSDEVEQRDPRNSCK